MANGGITMKENAPLLNKETIIVNYVSLLLYYLKYLALRFFGPVAKLLSSMPSD